MSEYARELVLPTKGIFYDEKVPGGRVTLEPMGTKEEKMLSAGRAGNVESILDRVFRTTLTCPIPANELKTVDRFFLLVKLRVMSYGAEYHFNYKCEDCNQKVSGIINLDEMEITHADDDMQEPFEVTLPMKGDTIQWKLLTGKDEANIRRTADGMHRKGRAQGGDPAYILRLCQHIVSVNNEERNIGDLIKYVESLKGQDSIVFRDAIEGRNEIGVNLLITCDCTYPNCGWPTELILPFGPEFFRPRSTNGRGHTGTAAAIDS
jgi:hypothetical protein